MASTLKNARFYTCETAQPNDLTQDQFAALTWVEVGNVGKVGETGTDANIVSYSLLGTNVTQKNKGEANAGDPTIECARVPTDAGQVLLRQQAKTKLNYAYKFEKDDAPTATKSNTIHYYRGICSGPKRPNGGGDDFDLEVFTLGLNQIEVTVDPADL